MSRLREILQSSFWAAAGIILPLILFGVLFERVVVLLNRITIPLAKVIFTEHFAESENAAKLATLLLLALTSLGLGLLAQTDAGQRIGHWVENHTLMQVKLYRTFKEFSDRLIPSKTNKFFQPGLLIRKDEMNTLVFVVEDFGHDYFVIFCPSAPSTLSGNLYIVPKSDVELLPVPAMDIARVYSRWGVGTSKVLVDSQALTALQGIERSITQ